MLRELEGREMNPLLALVAPHAWLEPQAMHEPVLGAVDAVDALAPGVADAVTADAGVLGVA